MTTEPLPAWTGDLDKGCKLEAGHYRARVVRRTHTAWTLRVRVTLLDATGDHSKTLFSTGSILGDIIGGDMARAICEALIREASRADEAEARVAEAEKEIERLTDDVQNLGYQIQDMGEESA